ncbi:MAG: hypothetical protein LC745_00980, partial [Planctomycetia bacterium]|nr:hypothetical protein [Planctomycetia bacterium]
ADGLRRETGLWVVPVYSEGDGRTLAARELAGAAVAMIPVGDDWATARDFGRTTEGIVEEAGCPLLVVRAAAATRPPAAGTLPRHDAEPAAV